ncbi:Putative O-methyltransferase [Fundidesulfovibrio magnetotacticus]|uniref:O-methyltransferase n=1 Tax=Fundidesulfovibrio magnetotacticus TaxID=2730080 RepID=A0A6V8LQY2_9BACT|nr:O-methyltransferase [Fundidesulfovibrio magnetotacticus]GFK94893.1 Putative O-methyltransferase [Fundidesulfovibrio magnetotacticus]
MFHSIPEAVTERMALLAAMHEADKTDGTPRFDRLRQIPPETGRFLCLLAANAPEGEWLEVGTSGGYSALWLAQAAGLRGTRLTTYEISPRKAALARESFAAAGAQDRVRLVEADAVPLLAGHGPLAFCFLDAERAILRACFDAIVPKLVPGGLLVVDNAISHSHEMAEFLEYVPTDPRVDSLVVPIGSGELVCRKL